MSSTPPGSPYPGYGPPAEQPPNEAEPVQSPDQSGQFAQPGYPAAPDYTPPPGSSFQPGYQQGQAGDQPQPAQPAYGGPAPQPNYGGQQNYGPPPRYGAPQGYEQAQGYQAPQGYQPPQAPQGYEQPQAPQGYQPPQAPQGYEQPQAPQGYQPQAPQGYEQPQGYQPPQTYAMPAQGQPAYGTEPQTSADPEPATTGYAPQPWQSGGGTGAGGAPQNGPQNQPYGQPQPLPSSYSQPSPQANLPYGGVPGFVVPAGFTPRSTSTRRGLGVIGLVIGAIGIALVLISFTALNWLTGDDGFGSTQKISFSNLHDLATADSSGTATLTKDYFNWLGWALLVAVIVFTILGNLPTKTHPLWRVLGILTGFGGAVLTFFAVDSGGTTLSDIYKFASFGFWLAIAGFIVAGIGAVVGPRRIRI